MAAKRFPAWTVEYTEVHYAGFKVKYFSTRKKAVLWRQS